MMGIIPSARGLRARQRAWQIELGPVCAVEDPSVRVKSVVAVRVRVDTAEEHARSQIGVVDPGSVDAFGGHSFGGFGRAPDPASALALPLIVERRGAV